MQTVQAVALSGLQTLPDADVQVLEGIFSFFAYGKGQQCCLANIDVCAAELVVIKITRVWVCYHTSSELESRAASAAPVRQMLLPCGQGCSRAADAAPVRPGLLPCGRCCSRAADAAPVRLQLRTHATLQACQRSFKLCGERSKRSSWLLG